MIIDQKRSIDLRRLIMSSAKFISDDLVGEGVMARSLKDLIGRAKDKLQYGDWSQVRSWS